MSAVASPYASPNLSRVGSQVSVVSGFQAQSQGSASGGRGGNVGLGGGGVGVVMQRHKNLVNMNAALMASAQGDWARAEEILRGLVDVNPDDFVVSHSFRAVSVLFFVSSDTSPGFGFGSGSGSNCTSLPFEDAHPGSPEIADARQTRLVVPFGGAWGNDQAVRSPCISLIPPSERRKSRLLPVSERSDRSPVSCLFIPSAGLAFFLRNVSFIFG